MRVVPIGNYRVAGAIIPLSKYLYRSTLFCQGDGFASLLLFHWMDSIVYRTIEYIPLVMGGLAAGIFAVRIVALSIGRFNHFNIRVRLGPIKCNNFQCMRWHHAKHWPERHRYGVNFRISLNVWDFLFGMAFTTPERESGIGSC